MDINQRADPVSSSGERSGPLQQHPALPWWFRIGQKIICVFAGIVCAALGIFVCVSLRATCIVGGILQVLLGLSLIMFEAPCCCAYLDFIDKISKFSETRPAWQKAALYCGTPFLPIALCPEVSTIVGCLLVFGAGLTFAYLTLGKKAPRDAMLQSARGQGYALIDKAPILSDAEPMAHGSISRIV